MSAAKDRLKVLVADDSAVYRKLVEQAFCDADYSLLIARSGREAIELLDQHAPAIVITDWVMPDLTGIELCERIIGNCQRLHIRNNFDQRIGQRKCGERSGGWRG